MKPIEILLLRTKLRMTQAQFGEMFGVNAMRVSRWEHGTSVPAAEIEASIKRKAAEIKRPYRPRKK